MRENANEYQNFENSFLKKKNALLGLIPLVEKS